MLLIVETFLAGPDDEPSAAPVTAAWHAGDDGDVRRFSAVDGFDDFVGPLDDVERVEADSGVRDLLAGDRLVDAAAVQADRFDVGGAVWAEGGEELFERGLRTLFADPDDVAAVVVGDDREELASAFVGDFFHADPVEVVQRVSSTWSATTRQTIASTASQEQRRSRAMLVLSVRSPATRPRSRSQWCAGHRAGPTAPALCGPGRMTGSPGGGCRLPARPGRRRSRDGASDVGRCRSALWLPASRGRPVGAVGGAVRSRFPGR